MIWARRNKLGCIDICEMIIMKAYALPYLVLIVLFALIAAFALFAIATGIKLRADI